MAVVLQVSIGGGQRASQGLAYCYAAKAGRQSSSISAIAGSSGRT